MASHKAYIYKTGFTLTKILVVMGIFGMLAGAVSFIDINNYRGDAFRAEVGTLGVALQTARASAFNNINQSRHGVAIAPSGCVGYLVFEGHSFASANHALDTCITAQYGVTLAPTSPTEVVFEQLSGGALTGAGALYDGEITFTDPNRGVSAAISINHEGRISW